MQFKGVHIKILFIPLLILAFTFCKKEEEPANTENPSNLQIEVLSVDHETGFVEIQATADNATLYELYIGLSEDPEDSNSTGFFEYTFSGPGTFPFSISAYGSSGKFISKDLEVEIIQEAEPIPLSRGYITPLEYAGYNLVWQDEFNGNQVNAQDWGYDIGNGTWGWGNNELQYYRADNSWVADSVLTIEARNESFGGQNYTSSRLKTQGKLSFQYGRIDVRALLPQGQGMWPAIWMLGENITQVSWPDCGEIDIMEMIGGTEYTTHGTAHWEFQGTHASSGQSKTLPSGGYSLAESYHVFSIEWDENFIKWFIDDQQYYSLNITGADMSEFHQPHFFILNVAVGGNWPGPPNATTIFPQHMKVDYIRVFQPE